MTDLANDPFPLLALTFAVALVPAFIVTMTAFVKIAIVLFLVRNALGIQQTPPNVALYGIALVLTVYVTAPLAAELRAILTDPDLSLTEVTDWPRALERLAEPIRAHLARFAAPEQRLFFVDATEQLWRRPAVEGAVEDDLLILLPAFMVSELTRAFEIGFLVYLPFLAIDLIVTNILVAMGMSMVSPNIVALPVKLFVFVLIDGWSRLTHGLVLSYA